MEEIIKITPIVRESILANPIDRNPFEVVDSIITREVALENDITRELALDTIIREGAPAHPLHYGLLAYWRFDENSGNALDAKGVWNGIPYGSLSYNQAGIVNTCNGYNGVSGFNIGNFGNDFVDNFSISCWFRKYALSCTNRRIISRWQDWELGLDANGFLIFDTGVEYSSGVDIESTNGVWFNVVVVINGANSKFYVNGIQAGSVFSPNIIPSSIYDTVIGQRNVG